MMLKIPLHEYHSTWNIVKLNWQKTVIHIDRKFHYENLFIYKFCQCSADSETW